MASCESYKKVIDANILLHSKVADEYHTEPHFRPENVQNVETKLLEIFRQTNATSLLDLGCGTGFIINIAKKYLPSITGVDATQAMLDKVDVSGSCKIELFNHDTGSFAVKHEAFDVVTAYSFLHHLYDVAPTLKTAYNALRPGGCFYVDLEPNFHFWEAINNLSPDQEYDPILKREVEMVTYIDEQTEKRFGIDKDVVNLAEYGKNVTGGFKEQQLLELFSTAGFTDIKIFYQWFIGQGFLINDETLSLSSRFEFAEMTDKILQKVMPLSRNLFKYVGVIATK